MTERRQRWQWIEEDGEDMLWNCPSCGRDINADHVGEKCPACDAPVEDDD
jgi:rubrerythrin